jgi:3',5'-cyclic AMP phosphodiesterase CpdA
MRKYTRLLAAMVTILSLFIFVTCTQQPGETGDIKNKFSFAFLTDIHVMPLRNAEAGFLQAIHKVNDLSPEFVIAGGDLVMDALGVSHDTAEMQYRIYQSLSDSFHMPVYNTLGNHEVFGWYASSGVDPSHPEYGKKMFENRIGPRFKVFEHKGWKFLILDSVIPNGEGGYMGGVDDEQLEWIKDILADTDTLQPIVISTHIPLLTVEMQILKGATTANHRGGVITNSKEVLDLFQNHNLKLVLQGHLHYLEDIFVWGTHFITGGAVSAGWWNGPVMQTEEGFLMIRVDEEDNFTWEYVDYGWEVAPGTHPPLR